jgi:all-trans-retinol dehydrogenase (NAD+)
MIKKTLEVNTLSHAYTVKEFLPAMLKKDHGHIVTIASLAGTTGVCGLADYCASKFGAFGFDESIRMELKKKGSNVKTTCVCPFFIDTGMFKGIKLSFQFIFPMLKEKYAANRILNGIRQNEVNKFSNSRAWL